MIALLCNVLDDDPTSLNGQGTYVTMVAGLHEPGPTRAWWRIPK